MKHAASRAAREAVLKIKVDVAPLLGHDGTADLRARPPSVHFAGWSPRWWCADRASSRRQQLGAGRKALAAASISPSSSRSSSWGRQFGAGRQKLAAASSAEQIGTIEPSACYVAIPMAENRSLVARLVAEPPR